METKHQPKLSIILPCLNEELSIRQCVFDIQNELKDKIDYEILIVNNNSSDDSEYVAMELQRKNSNIRVTFEGQIGYGAACIRGFDEAEGEYFLLMDIDQTYPVNKILDFVNEVEKGNDFVIGNRFTGKIQKGAMPKLHKFIGNPLLSYLIRLFFKTPIRDSHCGMRIITKHAYEKLNFRTSGMEFASEMVVKVLREKMKTSEIPISYHPRIGESKLKSFRDGWRHLRFMLLYSPLYLFLAPGIFCFSLGFISMIAIYFSKFNLAGFQLIVHPIFISSLLMIIGYQLILFTGFAKSYSVTHLQEKNDFIEKVFRIFTIDTAVILGLLGVIFGFIIYVLILYRWINSDFGSLNEIKNAIIGLTLIVLGIQTISSAFMISILGIKER